MRAAFGRIYNREQNTSHEETTKSAKDGPGTSHERDERRHQTSILHKTTRYGISTLHTQISHPVPHIPFTPSHPWPLNKTNAPRGTTLGLPQSTRHGAHPAQLHALNTRESCCTTRESRQKKVVGQHFWGRIENFRPAGNTTEIEHIGGRHQSAPQAQSLK